MERNFDDSDNDILVYEKEPLYMKTALGLKDSNLGGVSHKESQIPGMDHKESQLMQTPESSTGFKQLASVKSCHQSKARHT